MGHINLHHFIDCNRFVALFSATQNAGYDEFKKQIMWVLVSIPVMIIVILIDYEIFIKISPVLYGASLIFLIGVLFYRAYKWSFKLV